MKVHIFQTNDTYFIHILLHSIVHVKAPPSVLTPSKSTAMMDSCDSEDACDAPVHGIYEVFTTPYTTEDVARGVRATRSIDRGVLVEVAHCIRIPEDEYANHLRYSVLEHYLYVGRGGGMLLALGVGSLFNHSQQPNLSYSVDHDKLVIRYRAARAIAAHEELTITYGSSSKLWFEDRSMPGSVESSRVDMMHEDLDDETGFLGAFQL